MALPPPLSPMATLRWHQVNQVLTELRPSTVLELGCGQGGYGARIAARPGVSYVGLEPDEQSFTVARDRIGPLGGRVRHGTSDLLDDDERFDLVCAFEVIEHLEDDAGALRSWARHLNPGGAVLVSVPADPDRFGPMDSLVGHYRRYTSQSLGSVLEQAGCRSVTVRGYGWPFGYALEAVRNQIAARRSTPHPDDETGAMAQRSATSGRLLQPRQLAGTAVRLAVTPLAHLQRLQPDSGPGLLAYGRV